ncbi:hypothetical protein V6667_04280 [Neisseria leonii]|uniref:hypothetical protein n=1 Tax=Neisseria leonii TaxID=2995413 RepID=UPI0030CE0D92
MKKLLISASAMLALAGCAANQAPQAAETDVRAQAATTNSAPQLAAVDSIDSRIEVAYRCTTPQGVQPMSVMYGVKDGTLIVAQAKVNGELTPGLARVLNGVNSESQNSYYGNGLTWITDKATPADVTRVDGNMLTQAKELTVNGVPTGVQDILLKGCAVDTAATARLNRAAKR